MKISDTRTHARALNQCRGAVGALADDLMMMMPQLEKMSSTNGNTDDSPSTAPTATAVESVSATTGTDSIFDASIGPIGPDSPTERRIKARTLLEEVEENLAQSLLVFLVADLRLMSATGRIETKYETIAIASDPPSRSTAMELAGLKGPLPKNPVSESLVNNMEEGLSPAQIMAVLIIELKKTVDEARREEEERPRAEGMGFPGSRRAADAFKDEKFMYFEPDKKGNMKIRANEEDMHSLLKAYADMIGEDMKAEVPHIARRASMLYVASESTRSAVQLPHQPQLSCISEGEDEDEGTEGEAVGTAVGQAIGKAAGALQQAHAPLQQRAEELRQTIMTGPLMADEETRTNAEFREVTDALFRQGAGNSSLGDKMAGDISHSLSQEELLTIMENAVESRVYGKLDFLADFFREGTVSKLMAESNARVVWMNDWYPLKVCCFRSPI